MARTERYTVKQIADTMTACNGLVFNAAKKLQCNPKTIYDYMKKYPTLKQLQQDEQETVLDTAESKLYSAIESGQPWAICFFLKTRGKTRGYVERVEQTGKDGEPMATKVVIESAVKS